MTFTQPPPTLGHPFDDDWMLRSHLARVLPPEVGTQVLPDLRALSELCAKELYPLQLADRLNEPVLIQWDAWGKRIDRIELTRVWQAAERLAAEHGVVAVAYEARHGAFSRVHQFALAYLFAPATDMYACPLAMTDGAARTLLELNNRELIERAVPRLTSRDPARFWTSGQWMTELAGGSDVGRSETTARQDPDGTWRLYGRKWFTSAVTAPMALVLARPEGNPPGGRGLALFYVETRDAEGRPNRFQVNRLKDKLGTRKLPTAELTLDGTPAVPVAGLREGVRNIAPMLNITRLWNSVSAVAYMRRGLALARDYARKRVAFGAPLCDLPLHEDTLLHLEAEFAAAFQLAFYLVELRGQQEAGEIGEADALLLRLLTPIAKLLTAKQAIAVASEVLECFGGAGYVEDTGLPVLLRDCQVLSIWEGTTNVLSLDALRALKAAGGLAPVEDLLARLRPGVQEAALQRAFASAEAALDHARQWLARAEQEGPPALEAGARRFAVTLGRTIAAALLARHVQWFLDREHSVLCREAAWRFAAAGVDQILDF
jgi:acyl-CoA dehydrogenase